jgi:hypothetical protein
MYTLGTAYMKFSESNPVSLEGVKLAGPVMTILNEQIAYSARRRN